MCDFNFLAVTPAKAGVQAASDGAARLESRRLGNDDSNCKLRHYPLPSATLEEAVRRRYLRLCRSSAMAINGSWNKRCGPGGSARRLHHHTRVVGDEGAKQVRHAR